MVKYLLSTIEPHIFDKILPISPQALTHSNQYVASSILYSDRQQGHLILSFQMQMTK
jgi:hypothetical protein